MSKVKKGQRETKKVKGKQRRSKVKTVEKVKGQKTVKGQKWSKVVKGKKNVKKMSKTKVKKVNGQNMLFFNDISTCRLPALPIFVHLLSVCLSLTLCHNITVHPIE